MDKHAPILKFSYGQKVRFAAFKRPFRVRACDDRFAVCTQPFNLKRTVLYTIIDLKYGIRGTENLVFGRGFETDEKCREALERLKSGETELSHRNSVKLDITGISG